MSGEQRIDPEVLRDLAPHFETRAGTVLNRATTLVQGTPQALAYPAFSTIGIPLAAAYTESMFYMLANLDTKGTDLMHFRTNLETTADNWAEAEECSTVDAEG